MYVYISRFLGLPSMKRDYSMWRMNVKSQDKFGFDTVWMRRVPETILQLEPLSEEHCETS